MYNKYTIYITYAYIYTAEAISALTSQKFIDLFYVFF